MNGVPWITRICPKVSLDRKTVRAGTLKCVSLCSSRRTLCTSSAQTHVGSKCGCIEKIFSKSVFLLKQHAQNLPGTGLVYFYILGHFLLTVCSCHKSQTFLNVLFHSAAFKCVCRHSLQQSVTLMLSQTWVQFHTWNKPLHCIVPTHCWQKNIDLRSSGNILYSCWLIGVWSVLEHTNKESLHNTAGLISSRWWGNFDNANVQTVMDCTSQAHLKPAH